MFSSNKWNKTEGSPSSFWRKRQLISLNSSVFIESLPSFERASARARANHAKIDAQKGCAMQLNGITLSIQQVHAKYPRFVVQSECEYSFTYAILLNHKVLLKSFYLHGHSRT